MNIQLVLCIVTIEASKTRKKFIEVEYSHCQGITELLLVADTANLCARKVEVSIDTGTRG